MDSTTFEGLSFVVAACRLLSRREDDVYSIDIHDAARDAARHMYMQTYLPTARPWTPMVAK